MGLHLRIWATLSLGMNVWFLGWPTNFVPQSYVNIGLIAVLALQAFNIFRAIGVGALKS